MKDKPIRRDIIKLSFIIIVLLMMIIPAVTINTKPDVKSELDNRALVQFPKLTVLNDSFIAGLNDYVEGRIVFREQALAVYQIANDKLFHYLVHSLYEYGKDGWVMNKNWDIIQTFHLDFIMNVNGLKEHCNYYCCNKKEKKWR